MIMNQRQTLFSELLLLNPSVEEKDELRLSRQAREIYGLLQLGSARTSELATIGLQYNARINEIRHAIMELGLTIDLTEEGEGGNNKYEIVEFEGSRYQTHLRKKGLIWQ